MTNTLICSKCGKEMPQNLTYKTSSKFIPSGRLPFCLDCLCEIVDMRNIAEVDKLFQYADWPFNPSKWLLLCKGNLEPQTIFNTYYKMNLSSLYKNGYAEKVDWKTATEELLQLEQQGKLIETLNPEKQKTQPKPTKEQLWKGLCFDTLGRVVSVCWVVRDGEAQCQIDLEDLEADNS